MLAFHAHRNATRSARFDSLWERLKTGENLVVPMRHVHFTAGHPLVRDERGPCNGELVLSSAGMAHARRIGELEVPGKIVVRP